MVAKEDSSGGGGVADPQLKVFGVRVTDSSVPVAYLQAPAVYVAERAWRW